MFVLFYVILYMKCNLKFNYRGSWASNMPVWKHTGAKSGSECPKNPDPKKNYFGSTTLFTKINLLNVERLNVEMLNVDRVNVEMLPVN